VKKKKDNPEHIGIILPRFNDLYVANKNIVERLKKIYSKTFKFKNIIFYWHNCNSDFSDLVNISIKILKDRPKIIVIHNQIGHPYNLLKMLFNENNYSPKLYIHLWSNLVDSPTEWKLLGDLLAEKKISTQLIVATEIQKKFVDQFLDKSNETTVCKMPILEEGTTFDPKKREAWRKQNNLQDGDFVILIPGDLTIDSCYEILLKELFNLAAIRKKIKLIITGRHKDDRIPFWNIGPIKGHSYHLFENLFKNINPSFMQNICYIPNLNDQDMTPLLCGIDCCITLSLNQTDPLHQRSLLPAMALGATAMALNWGILTNQFDFLKLITVEMTKNGIQINRPHVSNLLLEVFAMMKKNSKTEQDTLRKEISKICIEYYSQKSIIKNLKKIISIPPTPFIGFNWKLNKTREINLSNTNSRIEGSLYFDLFNKYIQN